MDVIALLYYAAICGLLGWAAPHFGGRLPRFAVGVAVGLAAASLLPMLRALLAAPA